MLWMMCALAAPDVVERGSLVFDGVPEAPASLVERLRPYSQVRGAGLRGFQGGDEGIFITTRFGDSTQLHRVAMPGGAREQLTFFGERVRAVVPSPVDPNLVMVTRDVGGDENYQLWLLDLSLGEQTRISDGTGRIDTAAWSQDGSEVAWVQTTKGNERAFHAADPKTPGSQRLLWSGEGYFNVLAFMPKIDGKIVVSEYISAKESRLFTLPLKRRTMTPINPSRKAISYTSASLSTDGRHLYVVSDQDSDFDRLWRLDLKGGKHKLMTPDLQKNIEFVRVAPDGKHLLYGTNVDSGTKLHLKTLRGEDAAMPDIPPGVVYRADFDGAGKRVAFAISRPSAPSDVYAFEVGKTELVRWTKSEVGGLNTSELVEPEFFRYPSFDDLEIPAFVFRPDGEGPHPVVVSIHGGPESQARPSFSSTYQFWARELGVAVVVPNVRGSVGYGRAYHQADNDLKRKDSVKDIGALLDWIEKDPDLDQDRVVVYGGSYGGYMVLASLIDYADRLVGGVDIVGISDFKTFLMNTKDYRRDVRRSEYGDERIPKVARFFDEISPLKNANRIEDPLFVIQGANDPRVPASEAEQIVKAVRKNGKEAWYLLARDEGHGFAKKKNRNVQDASVALFLAQIFGLEL